MDTYQTASQMAPQTYDYEDYDRIWQRVLPELNTFPESRNEDGELPGTPIPGDDELMELLDVKYCIVHALAAREAKGRETRLLTHER